MYRGRIQMTVRYDGTDFAGSQAQPGRRTVAGTLKAGLESILGQAGRILFASRTDAGVHAEGNVCAFDAELPFSVERLSLLLNERLPGDLVARSASPAPPGFHPRFEATARVYAYRIYRDEDVPVDRMRYVAAWPGRWDWPAVREAAASIAGTHAFHAFAEGSLSPFYAKCTLDRLRTTERGPEVALHFRGDRFLRQMVRRLAAALCEVAAGRASPSTFAAAVEGKLRFQFKPAPAHGLVLEQVEYGNEDARDEHNAVLY